MHFNPASITEFGRIDHHRHARDVRSDATSSGRSYRHLRIEHRLVHVHVDICAAVLDLLARHARLPGSSSQDEAREGARAGDIGALADVDEQEPSPMFSGSRPERRSFFLVGGTLRGGRGRTASAMARMLGRGAAAAADDVEEALSRNS